MQNHSSFARQGYARVALFVVAAAACAAIPAAALLAKTGERPFTLVESGAHYSRLQKAVDAIGGGTGTIAIAPGRYHDCAVQVRGEVSYVATKPGTVVLDSTVCEGKAALVLRGRSASIAGIVFTGMESSDGNGAGIRIEKGNLTVSQSWFRDSQQGILSANDPASAIVIDKSTFTNLGTCEYSGGCAHSIYIGGYGALRITRSRFERGSGGHYVKSRAPGIQIASSSFDDSQGRGTNYMIDLPAGATGQISNNWFVQGRDKENYSAFIAIAAEGQNHPVEGLRIIGNDARFAPSLQRRSVFVADWTRDQIIVSGNRLGEGIARYERR